MLFTPTFLVIGPTLKAASVLSYVFLLREIEKMKLFLCVVLLFGGVFGLTTRPLYSAPVSGNAVQISDRAALQTFLGGAGKLEDFESLDISAGSTVSLNDGVFPTVFPMVLDSTTVAIDQGPGLILPGLSLKAAFLSWLGEGFRGAPSQEVVSQATYFDVDFLDPIDTFGVDLRSYQSMYKEAYVVVYAPDDTTVIGSASYSYGDNAQIPIFAGWHSSGGIGSIRLFQDLGPFSPSIDNLEFGIAVPEPSALALCLSSVVFLCGTYRN